MDSRVSRISPEPWNLPTPATSLRAQQCLADLIDRAAEGRAECLWIEGDAGTGKTALLDRLLDHASEMGCVVLRAECPFPGEGGLAWRRILGSARPPIPFEIVTRNLSPSVLASLRDLIPAPLKPASPRTKPSGRKAGDSIDLRRRSIALLCEAIARRGPSVLMIDDVQRADPDFVQQVLSLFRALAHTSWIWILAGEAVPPSGDLATLMEAFRKARRLTPLRLESWTAQEIEVVLESWLGPDDRERLAAWLMDKTAGNPFWVREVGRSLVESGWIVAQEGEERFRLTGALDDVPLPSSLEGILQERLRGIPPIALLMLRSLAALGGDGDLSLLRRVSGLDARAVRRGLTELAGANLIVPPQGRMDRCRIRQDWLGGVALSSFLDPDAPTLSLRAAQALMQDKTLPEGTRLARRGRALEKAGPGHWVAAASAFGDAARAAWKSHSQGVARSHVEAALHLLDAAASIDRQPSREKSRDDLEEKILDLAAAVHAGVGPYQKAVDEIDRLKALFQIRRPPPSRTQQARIEQMLGRAHRNLGHFEESLACYGRALRLLRKRAASRQQALLLLDMAWVNYESGNHPEGLRAARQAAVTLRRTGPLPEFLRARNLEGLIRWGQGRFREAGRIFQEILKKIAPLGTIPLESGIWNSLGLTQWNLGDLDGAARSFARARRIAMELGQLPGEASVLGNLAVVEEERGNLDAALRLTRRALRIKEDLGERRGMVIVLANLAAILRQKERLDEAREIAERALDECRAASLTDLEPAILSISAQVHRHVGCLTLAKEEARKALSLSRPLGNPRLVSSVLETLARVSADLGSVTEARAKMKEAKETIRATSSLDYSRILLSEAEMLTDIADGGKEIRTEVRSGLIDAARASAREADSLLQKLNARSRLAGTDRLFARLGLAAAPASVPSQRSAPILAPAVGGEGTLRIFCFGSLRIVSPSGKEMHPGDWGSHKARAIFAYLLFQRSPDRAVPKERILETIWPEAPVDTVENTFHATLAILRKTLTTTAHPDPPWAAVVHSGSSYRLDLPATTWIDCLAFEEGLREGTQWERHNNLLRALSTYQRAASLYQADFLDDSYHDWTDRFRERYRQGHTDLCLKLGVLNMETWNAEAALEWFLKVLSLDPLDERACRLAMHAHSILGHRRAAIDLYQHLLKQLKSELGAEPEAATIAIFRGIKTGQALPPPDLRQRDDSIASAGSPRTRG